AKCFLAEKRLERLKRAEQTLLVERLEPLEQASLRCVQSDGGAIRRSNGKFFRTIPVSLWNLKHNGLPIGRFERLEQSAVVERLERAAVIGERLNKSLDLLLTSQQLFANICLH